MPTVCEIIGKLKAKGISGYSGKTKGQMLTLLETGNAPKKAKAKPVKKVEKKVAPLKASGSARRVKAKDTDAGKVKSFLGRAETKTVSARVGNTRQEKPPAPAPAPALVPAPEEKKEESAVEQHTGLSRSELNKMDFFELMKELPSSVKDNITKQVKEIGAGDVSEKYLSSLPTNELLGKFTEYSSKVGYYSKYKGNALRMSSLALVKDVAKRYGRLPQTTVRTYRKGMDQQFNRGMMKVVTGEKEIYTAQQLYAKLVSQSPWNGKGFAKTLHSELMKRLGPAQQVSEKVYKKKLAENIRDLEDRRERVEAWKKSRENK